MTFKFLWRKSTFKEKKNLRNAISMTISLKCLASLFCCIFKIWVFMYPPQKLKNTEDNVWRENPVLIGNSSCYWRGRIHGIHEVDLLVPDNDPLSVLHVSANSGTLVPRVNTVTPFTLFRLCHSCTFAWIWE